MGKKEVGRGRWVDRMEGRREGEAPHETCREDRERGAEKEGDNHMRGVEQMERKDRRRERKMQVDMYLEMWLEKKIEMQRDM